MKKITFFVAGLFLLAVVFSGCTKKQEQQQEKTMQKEQEGAAMQNQEEVQNQFMEAMQEGKRVKCTYRSSEGDGDSEVVLYVEGNKHRTTTSVDGEGFEAVYDGDTYYTWPTQTKKGTKMSASCLESLDTEDLPEGEYENDADFNSYRTTEEVMNQEVEMSCSDIDKIDFSVPSDVEFTDQCEMLKNQMQMMEQMKNSMPEDMMQQFQGVN